jgi:hypothetical protein
MAAWDHLEKREKIVASRVSLFFPSTAVQILGRYKIGFLHLEIAFERSILGWLRFERQRALMNSMFPDGSGRCVILGGCVPRRERVRVPTF